MRPPTDAPVAAADRFRAGTRRGAEGFFQAGQLPDGTWTLTDPEGAPFFCAAVHGVRTSPPQPDGGLAPDTASQLRSWGFNTIGPGSDRAMQDDGLAYVVSADFCSCGPVIAAPGVRLPDVFDPDWPRRTAAHAQQTCPPHAASTLLLGWITDDTLAWGPSAASSQPGLLQVCLSLEPAFAAYHAAWEFALALHAGRMDALARAWGITLGNKEVVRDLTRHETRITSRGYLRDEARWTREFARRYFSATAAAIRAADPHHLVLGCRPEPAGAGATPHANPGVLQECTYPAVDVTLVNWTDLPPANAPAVQPLIASEVRWLEEKVAPAAARLRPRRLTAFERMLRRSRTALDRMARHPAVVGYAWSQWRDEPGEQPPFARGLVHAGGGEARENTELLAQFNARVKALRDTARSG